MTMISRHQYFRLLSIVTILALQWTGNHALEARDEPFNVTQPDGSVVQVVPNGDELDNFLTDRYGYGVEQDGTGYYVYVDESDTGEVVLTTEKVGKDGPKETKKNKRIHKKKSDCKRKMCGGTPEDPRKKTKRSRTLRGTRRAQDFVPQEESQAEMIGVQNRRRTIQTSGVIRNLVVLIHFKDHAEHKDRKHDIPTREDIDVLMNSEEPHPQFAPTGSLKSIYREVSYGKLTIESTVTEWFVSEHTEAWYADGDSGTTSLHEALRDSLDYLDQNNIINFKDYDSDGDGKIDAITFMHSGYAAEWMSPDQYGGTYRNRIWSHKWMIWGNSHGDYVGPWVSKDGITVYDYHISPALWGISGTEIGHVGVIAHESGHFMDLDDLYDTNGGGNGIGNYCFMSSSWGWDKSQEPPGSMTCWTKIELGWLTPQKPKIGVNTISDSMTSSDCIKIGDGEYGFPEGEYLLIENRQPIGLDSKIPQGGLAIYHIDESVSHDLEGHPGQYGWPMNGRHYKVALLQADGRYDLERRVNHGDGGDLFHGDGVDRLMPSRDRRGPHPNTDSYQKGRVLQTGVEIYGISKSNATMTFIFSDGTAELPSAQPTPIASSSPTANPSEIPTTSAAPSVSSEPSVSPAPTRTPYPTIHPSSAPTTGPSNSMAPSDLPSMVPTTSLPSAQPSTAPSQRFFTTGAITMVFQCMDKGQECESPTDCCNRQAQCKIMEKRRRKKVCSI